MQKVLIAVAASSLLMFLACGPKKTSGDAAPTAPVSPGKNAWGKIESRSGSKVTGDVSFKSAANGKVDVVVKVAGATPGDHAVHVHEKGDCSAPDAASAGGHFNPHNMAHGAPDATAHHAGDFGNMKVGPDGTGTIVLTVGGLTVDPGPTSVVGRALIVHEKADDLTTQPTGNAGGRQGCAVLSEK